MLVKEYIEPNKIRTTSVPEQNKTAKRQMSELPEEAGGRRNGFTFDHMVLSSAAV